jgi:dihydrofolate synthase / folylpolyglutamate synthase
MNYAATIDYLFTRLPMFTKIGAAAYKKDLHNIVLLEAANDNPHTKFKSIHITGTNGKGSTSHMLAAVLQKAGYKTGLYTSPHLYDFRERIKVNGEMISEEAVVAFTEKMLPIIPAIEPSFFEITVAMAFDWFVQQAVDIAIVEVGLGGRLDSTNIISPILSVITNIGWDHMNILGDSLEKIAFEKAGIIKAGTPVVIGETRTETASVFAAAAAEKNAPVYYAATLQQVISWEQQGVYLQVTVQETGHQDAKTFQLDLPGFYQVKNIGAILQSISILQQQGWLITTEHIRYGLAHTKSLTGLHGRWETIAWHPQVVLDVGHNEDGIRAITEQLELTPFNQLHIVMGMVKDKEINAVLALLPTNAKYYFTQASIPRALPATVLSELAAEFKLAGRPYSTVQQAFVAAKSAAEKDDLVLVCGSVFIVGELAR